MQTLTPAMRRSALIALLRDRSMWPPDFRWSFRDCRTCAIGMLREAMPGMKWDIVKDQDVNMARELGISRSAAYDIFIAHHGMESREITPEMVADRLEHLHREMGE
jgi:hypothetical protein